jgi:hypothetical protein
MPPKQRITKHSTESGQLTRVEKYKRVNAYKDMVIVKDRLASDIEAILQNNVWNLQDKFAQLTDYYDMIKAPNEQKDVAWLNNIQYLDFKGQVPPALNQISLKALKAGDYRGKYTNKGKPNSVDTEKEYGNKVRFWVNNFTPFNVFKNEDNLSWVIPNHRLIMYYILKYYNDNNKTVNTVNNHFKTLVRIIKLVLGEENELRYKYSALQIAFTDMENLNSDNNKLTNAQELRQFVPHEQLLDIIDDLERQYYNELSKLSPADRKDGYKHTNYIFEIHQKLLAVAINVWNYPSRHENYTLEFIEDDSDLEADKNYLLMSDGVCRLIYNEIVKEHEPFSYSISSKPIEGLNKRLNKLLKYSYKTYPRKHLFIGLKAWEQQNLKPVSHDTVSEWVRNILPNKNLGIDGFRKSFVSYYYKKFNNMQVSIMAKRMRTSKQEIQRAYYREYTTPDELIKVKIEPDLELQARVSSSTTKETAFIVDDEPRNRPIMRASVAIAVPKVPSREPAQSTQNRKKANFQRWYANPVNKVKHTNRVNEVSKQPITYAKRYIRELNSGKLDFNRMSPITIEKYKIVQLANGKYATEM